jgi:DNA-binding NarL/FixJ family response regulator
VSLVYMPGAKRSEAKEGVRARQNETRERRRPRVCVIESAHVPAYERLDECAIDVMAIVPKLSDADPALLRNFDIVLLGCSDALLLNQAFERRARRLAVLTKVVGVAARPAPESLAHAARVGFRGFVAREVPPAALDRTFDAVLRGEIAFPRAAFTPLANAARGAAFARGGEALLTERQQQILALIAAGAHDREIGERLHISNSTVEKHVQNALRRTGTRTRSELVASIRHRGRVGRAGSTSRSR